MIAQRLSGRIQQISQLRIRKEAATAGGEPQLRGGGAALQVWGGYSRGGCASPGGEGKGGASIREGGVVRPQGAGFARGGGTRPQGVAFGRGGQAFGGRGGGIAGGCFREEGILHY
jgi:hypothetical protein